MNISILRFVCLLLFIPVVVFGECAREGEGRVDVISNGDEETDHYANDVTISVIYDNRTYKDGFEPEWGFSCLLRGGGKTILFDTGGDGDIFIQNLEKLGIDPTGIDLVVLSHIHWDHVGGLDAFLDRNGDAGLFIPKSFPEQFRAGVEDRTSSITSVGEPVRICRGVYSTGEMGGTVKEQSMVVRTAGGLVVITGCAHPGIVNIVERAKDIYDDDVLLVLGGFHLLKKGSDELESIISDLMELGIKMAAPCHCTGDDAIARIEAAFGPRYVRVGVGEIIDTEHLGTADGESGTGGLE